MKYVDVNQISDSEGNLLARIILDAMTKYFDDPEHQRQFEEWKRERELQNRD